MAFRLFDVALNLSDPMFTKGMYREKLRHPADLPQVLRRALDCKVNSFLLTGTNYESSSKVLSLALEISCFSTAGIHPTHSLEFDKDFPRIRSLLLENNSRHNGIRAIGECGLDYDRLHFAPKSDQLKCFEAHFELAHTFNLPMFLHLRSADSDFLEVVGRNRHLFGRGVVHSFDGPVETAQSLIDLDLFIGLNGCSMKTEDNLKVIKSIPLERILIETDAPWCDIRPTHASFQHLTTNDNLEKIKLQYEIPSYKSLKKEKFQKGEMVKGRNEPCSLVQILCVIASVKQIDPGFVAETVWNNTLTFLGLDHVDSINAL